MGQSKKNELLDIKVAETPSNEQEGMWSEDFEVKILEIFKNSCLYANELYKACVKPSSVPGGPKEVYGDCTYDLLQLSKTMLELEMMTGLVGKGLDSLPDDVRLDFDYGEALAFFSLLEIENRGEWVKQDANFLLAMAWLVKGDLNSYGAFADYLTSLGLDPEQFLSKGGGKHYRYDFGKVPKAIFRGTYQE